MENRARSQSLVSESKVPEVTLGFWIIKIAATTLGETGGDTVTMTLNWGYLAGTFLFLAAMIVLVAAQIRATKLHPALYWATIVASTTFGTTMADFADRSLGIGSTGGSTLLLACLVLVLGLWYRAEGTISVNSVSTPRVEAFYWGAITFSQTLGTALGDWIADTGDMGYGGGALIFAAGLAIVAALYFWSRVSRVTLFWAAFILTRPLGATVGDFLDKPLDHGGLALSRPLASLVIAAFMVVCLLLIPQRAGQHPSNDHAAERA
ncbi:COG4705 family protein [Bradyrhizobium manausense]